MLYKIYCKYFLFFDMNTPHTFYGNFLLFLLLFGPLAHSILLGLSADYALYTIHAFFFLSLSHFFPDVERSFVFDDNNNSIYYMNNFMAVSVFENSIELYRIHGECRKFFFPLLLFACVYASASSSASITFDFIYWLFAFCFVFH